MASLLRKTVTLFLLLVAISCVILVWAHWTYNGQYAELKKKIGRMAREQAGLTGANEPIETQEKTNELLPVKGISSKDVSSSKDVLSSNHQIEKKQEKSNSTSPSSSSSLIHVIDLNSNSSDR